MKGITDLAESENRKLTEEESAEHIDLYNQVTQINTDLAVIEREKEVSGSVNTESIAIVPQKRVKEEVLDDQALNEGLADMFTALLKPKLSIEARIEKAGEAQKRLFEAGFFPEYKNVESFSTQTDAEGGIFIPTVVSDMVLDVAETYGVFSKYALRVPITKGREIFPNVTGQLTFYAVNEKEEALSSRMTFQGIALEDSKWMTYVPWSSEIEGLKGRMLVEIIVRKLGEGLARAQSNSIVNADGTSTYHNKVGIVARSADADYPEVRLSTAASGNTTFATVTPFDILNAKLDLIPSIRSRARLVLHPDWEVYLLQMLDADNNPYFSNGSGVVAFINGQYSVFNIPVEFDEAIPNTSGTSNTYGVLFVPEYFVFGTSPNFAMDSLDQATIPDEDGTDIRLAAMDMKAIRAKAFFDFELSQLTKNNLSAFTVLRTAAS